MGTGVAIEVPCFTSREERASNENSITSRIPHEQRSGAEPLAINRKSRATPRHEPRGASKVPRAARSTREGRRRRSEHGWHRRTETRAPVEGSVNRRVGRLTLSHRLAAASARGFGKPWSRLSDACPIRTLQSQPSFVLADGSASLFAPLRRESAWVRTRCAPRIGGCALPICCPQCWVFGGTRVPHGRVARFSRTADGPAERSDPPRKTGHNRSQRDTTTCLRWRRGSDSNRRMAVLQTAA